MTGPFQVSNVSPNVCAVNCPRWNVSQFMVISVIIMLCATQSGACFLLSAE